MRTRSRQALSRARRCARHRGLRFGRTTTAAAAIRRITASTAGASDPLTLLLPDTALPPEASSDPVSHIAVRVALTGTGALRQVTADVQQMVAHLMKRVEGHPSE